MVVTWFQRAYGIVELSAWGFQNGCVFKSCTIVY